MVIFSCYYALLLIHVHVLKRKKIPYWIWMRTPTNKFSLSDVGAGVIDVDYCGLVGVVLFNNSEADFAVKPSDRVTQMIVQVGTTKPTTVPFYFSSSLNSGLLSLVMLVWLQTDKASMLDEAILIEYLKQLQLQVQVSKCMSGWLVDVEANLLVHLF